MPAWHKQTITVIQKRVLSPIVCIMTQLGSAQSEPFQLADKKHKKNDDRRIKSDRRQQILSETLKNKRSGSDKRSTKNIWNWSATTATIP